MIEPRASASNKQRGGYSPRWVWLAGGGRGAAEISGRSAWAGCASRSIGLAVDRLAWSIGRAAGGALLAARPLGFQALSAAGRRGVAMVPSQRAEGSAETRRCRAACRLIGTYRTGCGVVRQLGAAAAGSGRGGGVPPSPTRTSPYAGRARQTPFLPNFGPSPLGCDRARVGFGAETDPRRMGSGVRDARESATLAASGRERGAGFSDVGLHRGPGGGSAATISGRAR